MAIAFRASITSTQKLVLLALADSANDLGECYPSVAALVPKCSLSERAVQKAISELESLGHIHRDFRTGRSTVYWVHPIEETPVPRAPHTPASCAPPHVVHPAPRAPTPAPPAPQPPHLVHPTPAPRAPITITEPSVEPSGKPKSARKQAPKVEVDVSLLIEAGFSRKNAEDFIDHKRMRKAPLTERAWKDHLRESATAGWSPEQAAEKVMARNWTGFEAKYVANERRPPPVGRPMQQPEITRAEKLAKTQRLLGINPTPPEAIDG